MKVLHVVPSFYPAHVYGGPIQSLYHLCCHLIRNGCDVKVLTTNANGRNAVLDVETEREVEVGEGLSVRYCKRWRAESTSVPLLRALGGYLRWADVVHLTAVYNFPVIPALFACKALGKPVVWSPRGALQRWEGSTRLRLKSAWERVCRLAAPAGTVLHVTSAEEARESLEKLPGLRAAVIPNAVEIPADPPWDAGSGALRLVFLGRLHPKKGLENLLAACKKLQLPREWSLVIAGGGDAAYAGALRERIGMLGLAARVTMAGEVTGSAKAELFGRADLLVAPSATENFGIVVAEALAYGVPVIASKGMPWREVEDQGCGVWVDNDPDTLAAAIEELSRMPLRAMGLRGRRWMERDFSWDSAARRMIGVYQETLRSARRAAARAFLGTAHRAE